MRNSLLKQLALIGLFLSASVILCSCKSKKEPPLQAEVKILNDSVYVWNRGTQPWPSGGEVYLNEQSLGIKRPMGSINPKGFAQLPLREFKQDSKPISVDSFDLKFVWVKVQGYEPKKFTIE